LPAGGGIEDLGEMCCDAIGAAAINGHGDVAWVGAAGSTFGLQLLRHGALTTLDADDVFQFGLHVAINNHDDVVAGASVWTRQAGWTGRSSAYVDEGFLRLWAINDRGDVVGADESFSDGMRGTLYPKKGAPVPFGLELVPQSINNAGVIVGPRGGFSGFSGVTMANTSALVRFTDGTIVELPKPSGFAPGTELLLGPAQINDAGLIVGYAEGTMGGATVRRAVVWRPVAAP
jgi:hypothetical protein